MIPFLDSDRAAWSNLIDQVLRLQNPKVRDLGPVKRAERACSGKVFPPTYQSAAGNPFSLLRRMVQTLPHDDAGRREQLIEQATACRGLLPGDDVTVQTHVVDPDAALTHIHDRRKDIYG